MMTIGIKFKLDQTNVKVTGNENVEKSSISSCKFDRFTSYQDHIDHQSIVH